MAVMAKPKRRDEHPRNQVRLPNVWLDSKDRKALAEIRAHMDLGSDTDALTQAIRVCHDRARNAEYEGKFHRSTDGLMEHGEPVTFRVSPVTAKKLESLYRWFGSGDKSSSIRLVIRMGRAILRRR